MENCVNEGTTDDRPRDNGDKIPPNTGVDIPESCRAIGITDKSDRAYIDLVAYNQLRLRIHN